MEPVTENHIGILMAASLAGVDIELCPGAFRMIGYGDTSYGYGPACIVDVAGTEFVAEPHVTWFPWVGTKDKITNFKWAMEFLAQNRQVFLMTEKKEAAFFEHFVKKGLLRKVGHLENIPLVDEVHMYQYKGESNEQVG
jgi:hypothetical protein